MATNKTLNNAKDKKQDEYYTRLGDISEELRHYKEHFKGKIVLCNCDDPYESNFFKYFAMNFNTFGLKKLICTSYAGSPVVYTQLSFLSDGSIVGDEKIYEQQRKPYKIEITEVKDLNGDGAIDLEDVELLLKSKEGRPKKLKGDGSFNSEECVKYLKEADIVVTNPPFSRLIDFFNLLIQYNKKFLILGTPNAIHYKDTFPLIKDNKMWVGYKSMSADMLFDVSPDFADWLVANKKKGSGYKIIDGVIKGRAPAIWYTNLEIEKRHEDLIMYKKYNAEEYPKYYNYDGIDVNKVSDIPYDYYGDMGVPDSFLEQYNPKQFELIGVGTDVPKNKEHISYKSKNLITYEENGKVVWSTKYSVAERKAGNSLRLDDNGKPGKLPFSRIIIRRRPEYEN